MEETHNYGPSGLFSTKLDCLKTLNIFKMVLDITVNICNRLAKIHASASQVFTDIQMDVASGSMIIITARRSTQNLWQYLNVEKAQVSNAQKYIISHN